MLLCVKLYLKRLLLVSLVFLNTSVLAAELSQRQWSNDTKALETQVIELLRVQFAERPCSGELRTYVDAYLTALKTIRDVIAPSSYLIFREMGFSTAQDISPFRKAITCEVVDTWILFERHIINKIEYTANVLAVLDR